MKTIHREQIYMEIDCVNLPATSHVCWHYFSNGGLEMWVTGAHDAPPMLHLWSLSIRILRRTRRTAQEAHASSNFITIFFLVFGSSPPRIFAFRVPFPHRPSASSYATERGPLNGCSWAHVSCLVSSWDFPVLRESQSSEGLSVRDPAAV